MTDLKKTSLPSAINPGNISHRGIFPLAREISHQLEHPFKFKKKKKGKCCNSNDVFSERNTVSFVVWSFVPDLRHISDHLRHGAKWAQHALPQSTFDCLWSFALWDGCEKWNQHTFVCAVPFYCTSFFFQDPCKNGWLAPPVAWFTNSSFSLASQCKVIIQLSNLKLWSQSIPCKIMIKKQIIGRFYIRRL